MGIADGKVLCDGEVVFEANDIRVGLFTPRRLMIMRRVAITGIDRIVDWK